MLDRRVSRRYNLSFPIQLDVTGGKGVHNCLGRTHDLSSRGVCVLLNVALVPGTKFAITIAIPAAMTGGSSVLVSGRSTVLRVAERNKVGYLAAMTIEGATLQRNES
jgi:hypothetical protein